MMVVDRETARAGRNKQRVQLDGTHCPSCVMGSNSCGMCLCQKHGEALLLLAVKQFDEAKETCHIHSHSYSTPGW